MGIFYDGGIGDFFFLVGHGCDRLVRVGVELLYATLCASVLLGPRCWWPSSPTASGFVHTGLQSLLTVFLASLPEAPWTFWFLKGGPSTRSRQGAAAQCVV